MSIPRYKVGTSDLNRYAHFPQVVDMACAHDSGMTMLSDGVREIVAP
jgi:hypothetical protein